MPPPPPSPSRSLSRCSALDNISSLKFIMLPQTSGTPFIPPAQQTCSSSTLARTQKTSRHTCELTQHSTKSNTVQTRLFVRTCTRHMQQVTILTRHTYIIITNHRHFLDHDPPNHPYRNRVRRGPWHQADTLVLVVGLVPVAINQTLSEKTGATAAR